MEGVVSAGFAVQLNGNDGDLRTLGGDLMPRLVFSRDSAKSRDN